MAITNIMVALAGGPKSSLPAKYAISLAARLKTNITVVHVVNEKIIHDLIRARVVVEQEARAYYRDLEDQGWVFLKKVKKLAESKGVNCEIHLLKGVVHEQIVAKLKESKTDLLVIGQLKEILSVKEVYIEEGERLFWEAPCPVLVVKNHEMVEALFKEQ
jgi:nucleotide-binding universal stress UspA family protein